MIWRPSLYEPVARPNPLALTVGRREWGWAGFWAVGIALLTSWPYAWGMALSTADQHFAGSILGVEDGNAYLAVMQQGRQGDWLFTIAYTPEPHRAEFFFIFYLLLGRLAALLSLDLLAVMNAARLAATAFGLLSFYNFAAYFLASLQVRRLALLLYGFTAGLGWLWLAVGLPANLNAMPVDLWVPDASFFLSALTYPHLTLAQGLLLWVVVAALRYFESGQGRWWAVGATAGLLASLIHPYKLVVLSAIIGAYLVWISYRRGAVAWSEGRRWALLVAPSLPYLAYAAWVFETNFAFKAWRDQNLLWSPAPQYYLLGFGLALPLAALGWWHHRRSHRFSFLIVWSLVVPLLLYFPSVMQRRFLDGYQAVLAVLAAAGLVWLAGRWGRPALTYGLLFIPLSLTNLLLLLVSLVILTAPPPTLFHPTDQRAAFHWLADHAAKGEVVLAAYETGNALPAYAPIRVFAGHGPETYRSEEKRQLVRQFFAAETGEAWRRALLAEYGVDYVYFGPAERRLGPAGLTTLPELALSYANDTVEIYRVRRGSEEARSP